jgi:hypothetical protein
MIVNESQWALGTARWLSDHPEQDECPNMAKPYIPYDGVVITRADALAAGLTRFFTGKPCKHGHLSERTSANGGCIACNAITAVALYHAETPEQRAERNERTKVWKDAHRDQVRAEGRAYSQAHREQANAWKAANRDKLNAAERESRLRDPETHKARTARYLATDKAKAVRQAYYVANVETIKRRVKDWAEQNPDRILENRKKHYEARWSANQRPELPCQTLCRRRQSYAGRNPGSAQSPEWQVRLLPCVVERCPPRRPHRPSV